MKIAMNLEVIDRFERILRNTPILTDIEEKALLEIKNQEYTFVSYRVVLSIFREIKAGQHISPKNICTNVRKLKSIK